jgi:hypothetical protein
VGGISLIELNMLEKEFLNIINWKLSCSGALLQHYYTSLVKSHQSYQLDQPSKHSSQQATSQQDSTYELHNENDEKNQAQNISVTTNEVDMVG